MLFSEANNEYEMNKLWDQIRRESREEGREEARKETRKEVRKEDREKLLKIMYEKGLNEEMIDSICKEFMKESSEE